MALPTETVDLQFGLNGVLKALPAVVALAGVLAVFISPAAPGWKAVMLGLLVPCALVVRRADRQCHRRGMVSIYPDGTTRLRPAGSPETRAVLQQNAWTSRWFSVLVLIEPEENRHYHCVVCASANSAGDYRRLLKFLHMRTSAPGTHKARLW